MLTVVTYIKMAFIRSPFVQSSKIVDSTGLCFLSCSSRLWYFRPCCIIRGRRQQWLTGIKGQSENRSRRSCKVQPISARTDVSLSWESRTWLPTSAVYHWCNRRDSCEYISMQLQRAPKRKEKPLCGALQWWRACITVRTWSCIWLAQMLSTPPRGIKPLPSCQIPLLLLNSTWKSTFH